MLATWIFRNGEDVGEEDGRDDHIVFSKVLVDVKKLLKLRTLGMKKRFEKKGFKFSLLSSSNHSDSIPSY